MSKSKDSFNSDVVLTFAQKAKRFTTQGVAGRFKVPKQRAAACIAILRIKEVVESDGKTRDGDSKWVYCG
jgi:hypothetical protein